MKNFILFSNFKFQEANSQFSKRKKLTLPRLSNLPRHPKFPKHPNLPKLKELKRRKPPNPINPKENQEGQKVSKIRTKKSLHPKPFPKNIYLPLILIQVRKRLKNNIKSKNQKNQAEVIKGIDRMFQRQQRHHRPKR